MGVEEKRIKRRVLRYLAERETDWKKSYQGWDRFKKCKSEKGLGERVERGLEKGLREGLRGEDTVGV